MKKYLQLTPNVQGGKLINVVVAVKVSEFRALAGVIFCFVLGQDKGQDTLLPQCLSLSLHPGV